MTGTESADSRRRIRRTAVSVCLFAALGFLAVRLLVDASHRDTGKGLLVGCLLLGAAWLVWMVLRSLQAQRLEPLRARCSSPRRPAVVPADLCCIISEAQGARKSREHYARNLGPRLEDIATRRGIVVAPPEAGASRGASRGASIEEIEAVISRIEEP